MKRSTRITVESYNGNQNQFAKVEWNDIGELCEIEAWDIGSIRVSEDTLRELYGCLDFLFSNPARKEIKIDASGTTLST